MSKARRHARIDPNIWAHIPYAYPEKGAPYHIGQELLVTAPISTPYLPCIPKPMQVNPIHGLTRLPNGSMVTYCGLLEIAEDVMLMHFIYEANHILLGLGAQKYLTSPPSLIRKSKKRKSLSKKSPLYLARLQKKNRAKNGR